MSAKDNLPGIQGVCDKYRRTARILTELLNHAAIREILPLRKLIQIELMETERMLRSARKSDLKINPILLGMP